MSILSCKHLTSLLVPPVFSVDNNMQDLLKGSEVQLDVNVVDQHMMKKIGLDWSNGTPTCNGVYLVLCWKGQIFVNCVLLMEMGMYE